MDRPRQKTQQLKIESGQTPPFVDESQYEYGQPAPIRELSPAQQTASSVLSAIVNPAQYLPEMFPDSPLLAKNQPGYGVPSAEEQAFRRAQAAIGTGPAYQFGTPVEPTPAPSFDEYLASLGLLGGGGGAVRPDYSAYRAALTDQAQQLNAQIQAMYNELAGQAGENVGRIQDIYGGATAGIEAGYGSAAENVAQAYESAQQQAAEQMARLGIEEAAQQVLPTQALSQAEAVAGLEAGRAGGLSAAERYGASGAQFGSEMAQVAQQQGTEMNAAILAALQNRLNESLLAEAQGAVSGGGGGGMSVSDMLRLQDAYRQDVLGELPIEEQRRAVEMAAEEEQGLREERATLNYRAAQLATDLAPMNASPEEMQQAYELALSMLSR